MKKKLKMKIKSLGGLLAGGLLAIGGVWMVLFTSIKGHDNFNMLFFGQIAILTGLVIITTVHKTTWIFKLSGTITGFTLLLYGIAYDLNHAIVLGVAVLVPVISLIGENLIKRYYQQ